MKRWLCLVIALVFQLHAEALVFFAFDGYAITRP